MTKKEKCVEEIVFQKCASEELRRAGETNCASTCNLASFSQKAPQRRVQTSQRLNSSTLQLTPAHDPRTGYAWGRIALSQF